MIELTRSCEWISSWYLKVEWIDKSTFMAGRISSVFSGLFVTFGLIPIDLWIQMKHNYIIEVLCVNPI